MTTSLNVDLASKHQFKTADLYQQNVETPPAFLQMPVKILAQIGSWVATGDTYDEVVKNIIKAGRVCAFSHLIFHEWKDKIESKHNSAINDLALTIVNRAPTSKEQGLKPNATTRQEKKALRSIEKAQINELYHLSHITALLRCSGVNKDDACIRKFFRLLPELRDLCVATSHSLNASASKHLNNKIESALKAFGRKFIEGLDEIDKIASQPINENGEEFYHKTQKVASLFGTVLFEDWRKTQEFVQTIFFKKVLACHPLQEFKDVLDQTVNTPVFMHKLRNAIAVALKQNKEDQIKQLKADLGSFACEAIMSHAGCEQYQKR